jgi:hypothetical protein
LANLNHVQLVVNKDQNEISSLQSKTALEWLPMISEISRFVLLD